MSLDIAQASHRLRLRLAEIPGVAGVLALDRTGSTNDEARRLAETGAPSGTVVVASSQSHGRGRRGRAWHSPPGLGLYLSVLFRPRATVADAIRWTLASGVAACEASRAAGALGVSIEWPNDLVWAGCKVAGTLVELRSAGEGIADLVVGTGFNLNHRAQDFPPELRGRAASLAMACGGGTLDGGEVAAEYLSRLFPLHQALERGEWSSLLEAWRRLAPSSEGVRVRVLPADGQGPFVARTLGLDARGALRVRREDGRIEALSFAESVDPL